MKKITWVAAMLLSVSSLFAQGRNGLWLSPVFRAGTMGIIGAPGSTDLSSNLNVGVGLDAGYMFNDHLGVYAGLACQQYNFQVKAYMDGSTARQDIKGRNRTFEIPFYLRYVAGGQGGTTLVADIGISQELLFSAKTQYTPWPAPPVTTPTSSAPVTSKDRSLYRGYNLSPFVFIGLNRSKHTRFPEINAGIFCSYRTNSLFADGAKNPGRFLTAGIRLSFPVMCMVTSRKS